MVRLRFPVAACAALLLLSLGSPCLAQEQAAAEALFRSAREAADRGDWVMACDRFEESLRLEPAPGTVLNLANCREELGQFASAWKRYGEVVQRLPNTDSRVAYARDKERALEPRVPRLTLLAPETDEDFHVTVNRMEVAPAAFGVPLPFDPGRIVILVEAEGRAPLERVLALGVGERVSEQLELGELLVTREEKSLGDAAPAASGSSGRTWGFVALGVGAAGVAAAVTGFVWAGNEAAITADPAHCLGRTCDRVGFDASNRGEAAVILGWTGVAVGALGLGLGTFLLTTAGGETVSMSVRPLWGGAALSIGGQL